MSREVQLKELNGRADAAAIDVDVDAEHKPEVSRRASNAALSRAAVQMRGGGEQADEQSIHAAAEQGVQSPGGALPYLDQIQRSFGRHDVSGIQAHTGQDAAQASRAMGAEAFATGNHVAFAGQPDLHTAAHEAAHVVQQRKGVQFKLGVGAAGDAYEQEADRVADAVVQGKSAEHLLGPATENATAAPTGAVQRKATADAKEAHDSSDIHSRVAVSASLLMFADLLHQRGQDLNELVGRPTDAQRGDGDRISKVKEIYDEVKSEARHAMAMIRGPNLPTHIKQHMAPAVKKILGAWIRFAPYLTKANQWLANNREVQETKKHGGTVPFHEPAHIKQYIDGYTEQIGYDSTVTLTPDTKRPDESESELAAGALDVHVKAAMYAIAAVDAGNAADLARISFHVKEIVNLASGHKKEAKSERGDIKKLVKALQELLKSHPGFKDTLQPLIKDLNPYD